MSSAAICDECERIVKSFEVLHCAKAKTHARSEMRKVRCRNGSKKNCCHGKSLITDAAQAVKKLLKWRC